jgi:hypothetical protein
LRPEIKKYFFERYSAQDILVVPGHWPDFKGKAEVDEWLDCLRRIQGIFRKG